MEKKYRDLPQGSYRLSENLTALLNALEPRRRKLHQTKSLNQFGSSNLINSFLQLSRIKTWCPHLSLKFD